MLGDRRPCLDPARTPLADPEALPWMEAGDLGPTAVIAPHADDESLGCGGLIARLSDLGLAALVVFVSDGTRSHPNSKRFPAEKLRALRELEATRALECLNTKGPIRSAFLGWPDTAVPGEAGEGFDEAVGQVVRLLRDFRPSTVLMPWRRDPHCDHRASRQIGQVASARLDFAPRVFEYPVWAYESSDPDDAPRWDEVVALRIDVADVLPRKRAAIAAHRSQTTGLIDDDPTGFRLSAGMLAHFDRPWEIFLESPRDG